MLSSCRELLSFYLKSSFATWEQSSFLQRKGVCIGSCIIPILSDIYLAHHDRGLFNILADSNVVKVFGYVDDFLAILDCTNHDVTHLVSNVLSSVFSDWPY